MALRDAINVVIKRIRTEAEHLREGKDKPPASTVDFAALIEGWADILEASNLAAGTEEASDTSERGKASTSAKTALNLAAHGCNPQGPRLAEDRARRWLGQQAIEEDAGPVQVFAVGGPADNALVPVNPKMPIGAKMFAAGAVYVFAEDRHLHYSEQETARYNKLKKSGTPAAENFGHSWASTPGEKE